MYARVRIVSKQVVIERNMANVLPRELIDPNDQIDDEDENIADLSCMFAIMNDTKIHNSENIKK